MAHSTPNPQVSAPFTLVYAGNRTGRVDSATYDSVDAAITAAENAIEAGETILVRGILLLRGKALSVPASVVTP